MRPRRSACSVVAIVATVVSGAPDAIAGAGGATLTAPDLVVDTFVDEADGSCADGDCSLRDAVAATEAGDVVEVTPGYYALTLEEAGRTSDGTIELTRAITIRGRGDSGVFLERGPLGADRAVGCEAVRRGT